MDYLRKVFNRRERYILTTAAVSFAVFLILLIIGVKNANRLNDQQLPKRWSKEDDYAQISMFVSDLTFFGENEMKQLKFDIETQLDEDSIVSNKKSARRAVYAYSIPLKLTLSSQDLSQEVKAYAVGEDFFLFHPMQLLSGAFIDTEDVNGDHIVIDYDTAWILFGSYDVCGQQVMISDIPFVISGVVERGDSKLDLLAGNKGPMIFISFAAAKEMLLIDDHIGTFEALLPNPVKGYALKTVSDRAIKEESEREIVENSSRFSWTKLVKIAFTKAQRSMNAKAVVFPYWENMARGMEARLSTLTVIALLFLLYPMIVVATLLIRMYRLRTIHRKDIKRYIERRVEILREKRKHPKEEEDYL